MSRTSAVSTIHAGHRRCWRCAEEEASCGARALHAAREQLRIARQRSADRRWRAENAQAAGQEAFAQGLLDAADAHELAARAAEVLIADLERGCRELLREAEALVHLDRQANGEEQVVDCPHCRRQEVA